MRAIFRGRGKIFFVTLEDNICCFGQCKFCFICDEDES